jgi:hypothetical protein
MIIDLDSWEIGYADGKLSHVSACPSDRDEASYSCGCREGCAARAGTRREARRRYPDPTHWHLRCRSLAVPTLGMTIVQEIIFALTAAAGAVAGSKLIVWGWHLPQALL